MRTLNCLKVFIYVLAPISALSGQEFLTNGNFESELPPSWEMTTVPQSGITPFGENSPFTYPYGPGILSLRLHDDDSDFQAPSLRQSFAPTPVVFFGFDFKVPSTTTGSSWYVAWEGDKMDQPTTAFFFTLGGADGGSLLFNQGKITDLATNTWYHIQGYADAPRQIVEGFFVNERGQRGDFHGGFPFNVMNQISSVFISDADAAQNSDVLIDNFATRQVSLELFQYSGGQEVLRWLGSTNVILQSTGALEPGVQWTNVVTVNTSYTNTTAGTSRFFRLVRP